MEIKKNRYGVERVYEKIDETRIRITGESLFTRGSNDENGVQMMFDFEGGPCYCWWNFGLYEYKMVSQINYC